MGSDERRGASGLWYGHMTMTMTSVSKALALIGMKYMAVMGMTTLYDILRGMNLTTKLGRWKSYMS
jgi:hypothetical protein